MNKDNFIMIKSETKNNLRKPSSRIKNILTTNIRTLRKLKGLSQEELALICNLHRTYVGSVERGERNVTLSTLEAIAEALEVSVPTLLTDRDSEDKDGRPQQYVNRIKKSNFSIYEPIDIGDPELWIPTPELEDLLNDSLKGVSVAGLPLRTRSKVVKEHICKALGYPVPSKFRKTHPRFPGNYSILISHLFLTTGEKFFTRFPQFQGKVLNKKLQIPLPTGFFDN
jgi:transcriptional regulator with XRE-family HTH domain